MWRGVLLLLLLVVGGNEVRGHDTPAALSMYRLAHVATRTVAPAATAALLRLLLVGRGQGRPEAPMIW